MKTVNRGEPFNYDGANWIVDSVTTDGVLCERLHWGPSSDGTVVGWNRTGDKQLVPVNVWEDS